jgi:hypothetical protein
MPCEGSPSTSHAADYVKTTWSSVIGSRGWRRQARRKRTRPVKRRVIIRKNVYTKKREPQEWAKRSPNPPTRAIPRYYGVFVARTASTPLFTANESLETFCMATTRTVERLPLTARARTPARGCTPAADAPIASAIIARLLGARGV